MVQDLNSSALAMKSSGKRQRIAYFGDQPKIHDLTSQYGILASLAKNLSSLDLTNFGLASRTTWNHLSSLDSPSRLRKGLAKRALKCNGLHIQPRPQSPHQGTPYVMPCSSSQLTPVRQCEGCGIAICETCRFKPSHGAMLTYTHKRRWFFPSKSPSRPDTITTNLETMLDSMTRRGRIARRGSNNSPLLPTEQLFHDLNSCTSKSCSCTVESRWLDPWLCVPCLNRDIFSAPTHEAYYARRRSSVSLSCQQGQDVGQLAEILDPDSTAPRDLARRLKSMEQCSLCKKRLPRKDPARKGRCLPVLEERKRREQLNFAAKNLQWRRSLPGVVSQSGPCVLTSARNRRGSTGSWPRAKGIKKVCLADRKADLRTRRRSEVAVLEE